MARDFHDQFPVARAVFAEASEALSLDLAALCFEEDPRLDLTEFTQPAIVTAEVAMLRALAGEYGLSPSHFGGHSLGEYTALCAAGALPLADAVRLVKKRGALMQQAVPVGQGAMSAILKLDRAPLEQICKEIEAETGLCVEPVNYNSPGHRFDMGSMDRGVRGFREVGET